MAWRDQDATNLAVSYDRVNKRSSPLLVIGLGGTGCDMLRTVKRTFAERFNLPQDDEGHTIPVPAHTAFLAIDTEPYAFEDFGAGERLSILVPDVARILNDHEALLTPQERTWIHTRLTSFYPGSMDVCRPIARLMLSRNFNWVREVIRSALKRIATMEEDGWTDLGRVEIVILTSVGGGTGSGIFLDIPQIVRQIMATDIMLSSKQYKITGYLVMPDISLARVKSDAMSGWIRANAYAALKELDFWMGYDTHRTHYTMTYGDGTQIDWVRPYDDCVLLSGTDVRGNPVSDPYKAIQTLVAETLLHYFASETTAGGYEDFSYTSYENNLDAQVSLLKREMPLHYRYRAIGAYAMAVPKKKLIFYEGSLLFNAFMPPRDQGGALAPNDDLLKDGQTSAHVSDMTGDIGTLYRQFADNNPYPAVFDNLDPSNKTQMNTLRAMQSAPHDCYRQDPPWDETVLEPAAREAAAEYLATMWRHFEDFCSSVMGDPAQGPYSLLLYLTDEGEAGFMSALRGVEQEWNNYAANLHNDVAPHYDACVSTYSAFMNPPLLGGGKAVRNYLTSLTELLNAVRRDCFMREYHRTMELFIKRVEEYVRTSLRSLCNALEALGSELAAGVETADDLHGDLFDIHKITYAIDAAFATQNQNNKVARDFLEKLCRRSLETVENADPHGCGVTFTFARDARDDIMVIMRDELNANLSDVNDQSLDAIMVQAGYTDAEAQNVYIDNLGEQALRNAKPLFDQAIEVADMERVEQSFLSVPKDAPRHVKQLRQTMSIRSVAIDESALRDQIYCLTIWDGLPLYRYGLLDKMEADYEATLQTARGPGLHLVWNGRDSTYASNWTKLPNPKPYYLFHPKCGTPRARKEYADAREIVDRALQAGLLTMDTRQARPGYTFRAFYTDETHRMLMHASVIESKVNELVSGGEAEDGGKLRGEALRQALEALMAQAAEEKVEPQKKPTFMAGMLAIQDQPLDPFDPQVQAYPRALAQARANHEALCREFAAVVLLQRPELYERVCAQLPGFEAIRAALEKIDR